MALQLIARGVKLYKDPNTGRIYARKKGARRGGSFSGEDYEGDIGEDYEGNFGDDDYEGEDMEGDFGAAQDRLARKERRWGRRDARRGAYRDRVRDRLSDGGVDGQPAVISGSVTLGAAGQATINIRLQHDFAADDITFDGSTAGTLVDSIFFGDDHVWSSSTGVPINVFAIGSFIRNFLRGRTCPAGLDIIINGTLTGAGTFLATLVGEK